ncbi:oxidoreductase [Brevibacillus laterosporus]|uniref:oxidoreductase n=1 Tax=Brevibacillus laterosporus TaxID=1465 RepID=UPI0018CDA780|nr:oxidoreductase [Brevibacillus laterosporus]MBG9798071.1 oxidoreductase [Brevibacillus laterosporus]MCR8938447.1 oxidoreductase [Brevibacillus laterosporus]MCZ0841087.1 oxidoreductase [Brevibacillus laterosporus]MCZ0844931.1 oxidoreductase [Brevibacillus laterosporus]MED1912254.1 oxidoreductase [Brevibacillus laterosporus]
MQKIRVGIVGYGPSATTFHVPFLQASEHYEIVAVLSSKPEKVKADLGDVQVVSQLQELLQHPKMELVIITAPTSLHYEMVKEAIHAGVHIVVEKPFVVTTQEADELIELNKPTGKVLSVYQNRRWDNDFLTIQRLYQEGRLGDIYHFESHYDRYRPEVRDRWRENAGPGSGILYDLGSHLLDQAIMMFGMPKAVTADVQAQRPGAKTDDYFHVILQYERLRVILHAGMLTVQPGPRFQVHGDKGSYSKFGFDVQEGAIRNNQPLNVPNWGQEEKEWYGELTTMVEGKPVTEKIVSEKGSYQRYYDKLYEAIRLGKNVPVRAEQARMNIFLIEVAFKSSRKGRTIYID